MTNRLLACTIVIIVALQAFSQGVTFRSAEIEAGVKKHIGLAEGEAVTVEQLDTITTLNLSGLGITDLQDIRMIPNIQKIDLSYNEIDDVAPLAHLEYLTSVNLSHNMLNSVNMLTFTPVDEMTVDVGFNYITDFSCFNTLTSCVFIIKGAGLQRTHDTAAYDASLLYCNATSETPSVICRVEANEGEHVWLSWQGTNVDVPTDNSLFSYELGNTVTTTSPVYVTNGTQKDSIYYVPVIVKEAVKPLEAVVIETGLPERYAIQILSPVRKGTVTIDGTTITYDPSKSFRNDEVLFTYSDGISTKGVSKMVLSSGIVDIPGDANGDGKVNITDAVAVVDDILGNTSEDFIFEAADVNQDGNVNITDAVGIVDVILSGDASSGIYVSRKEIDFGMVEVGKSKTATFIVSNMDKVAHTIRVPQVEDGFEVSDADVEFSLAPGESKEFTITCHGRGKGSEAWVEFRIISDAEIGTQTVRASVVGWDSTPLLETTSLSLKVGNEVSIKMQGSNLGTYVITNNNPDIVSAEEGGSTTYSGGIGTDGNWSSGYSFLNIKALSIGTATVKVVDTGTNEEATVTIGVSETNEYGGEIR